MQPQTAPQPLLYLSNLTIDEVNTIFAGLDELQQKRSRPVTDKIIAQVNLQLNPPPAPKIDGGADTSSESASDASAAPGLSAPE